MSRPYILGFGGGGILENQGLAARANILESYYYIADWQTENLHRFKRFLLDSGAFTAMYGAGMEVSGLPDYVERYIQYINDRGTGRRI